MNNTCGAALLFPLNPTDLPFVTSANHDVRGFCKWISTGPSGLLCYPTASDRLRWSLFADHRLLRLWFVLPPGSPFGLGPLGMDNATLIAPLITPSSPAPLLRAPKTDWIGVCCLSACPPGIMTGYQKTTACLLTPDGRKRAVLLGARFNKPGRRARDPTAAFILPI